MTRVTSIFQHFPERLQRAIVQRLGWPSLRPVQEDAGEAILRGKNAVVLAPTAGGKTEASIFPVLAKLIEKPPKGVGVVYIAPIKALLNNQIDRLGLYTNMIGMDRFCWHGDIKRYQKKKFLKNPCELLMTTPESLEVMLLSQSMPAHKLFEDLRFIIIDEIHAIAGEDRGAHLMSVIERIADLSEKDIQRIGLSATVGNPENVMSWLQGTSSRESVVISPPDQPSRKALLVHFEETVPAIARVASKNAYGKKSLFFCQSRSFSEAVADSMRGRNIEVFVHHSSVSREERAEAEEKFSRGQNVSIVCTSTLELGIDVGDLDLVLQANAPNNVSSFLQRLGRTGRRKGSTANTTFYCDNAEAVLQAISIVELAKKGWVEPVRINQRCWPVMVHQLLVLTLQHGAVEVSQVWSKLSRVTDFAGITRPEFDRLISYMSRKDFLQRSGNILTMGLKAERVYGRRNFMEMYAVFSSPQLYTVKTQNEKIIGSLAQSFVDRQEEGLSSFLLSGRAWQIIAINHSQRTITVAPAPTGVKPGWGGITPQLLSFELCHQMRDVLISPDDIPYVSSKAQKELNMLRGELGNILARSGHSIQVEADSATWWTFAGGQINHTLRYGFQLHCGWKASADNLKVTIQGDGLSFAAIKEAVNDFARENFWRNPEMTHRILGALPEYRLSKFQKALPESYALETIARYLLDLPGTVSFLGGITLDPGSCVSVLNKKEELEDYSEEPDENERFNTHLPLYKLDAIAASEPMSEFGAEAPVQYVEAEGWIPVDIGQRLNERMFVCRIKGHSMDSAKIGLNHGDLAVFELWPRGTRQYKIVLVRGAFNDPDTGSYAVKRYVADQRDKSGQHRVIRLVSLNPDKEIYPDLILTPEHEDDITVVAEFVTTLSGRQVRLPSRKSDPVDSREKNRGRAENRLVSAVESFLKAKPDDLLDKDIGLETSHTLDITLNKYILHKVFKGGLAVEFEPLPDLLPFISALKICSNDGNETTILAGNTRTRQWGSSVAPGIDGVQVVVLGFEKDPHVQALVSHLTLPALSVDEPTVFKVDSKGTGRYIQGHSLTAGQCYRILLPPALGEADLPFKEKNSLSSDWTVVEVNLRQEPDDAFRLALEKIGIQISKGSVQACFLLTGRFYRTTDRGIEYPCFKSSDNIVIKVDTPELKNTEFELILAGGERTKRTSLSTGMQQTVVLRGLLPGLYALEVYDTLRFCTPSRLFFAIEDKILPCSPTSIISSKMTLKTKSQHHQIKGINIIRGDFSRLPGDWRLAGPPCWPVQISWRGIESLNPVRSAADHNGYFDIAYIQRYTESSRRALCGDLVLNFGELGTLILQHDRHIEKELDTLRSDMNSALQRAVEHGFDDAFTMKYWLNYVFEALGYYLTDESMDSTIEGIQFISGLYTYKRNQEGQIVPSALLVAVKPGENLLDRATGSLLARISKMLRALPYRQAFVVDGLNWTILSPKKLFRIRPTNIREALADGLLFEEFLNRYMIRSIS